MTALEQRRLRQERLAGLLLIAAAGLALLAANSGAAGRYHDLLHHEIGPAFPRLGVFSIHEWIADGLMAIFFLLVGLEVKREWFEGPLSTAAARRLPIVAAVAGMAVPAALYVLIAGANPALRAGWAIPAATDIAFAIGVLAILGRHAPPSIKLLLVTIAIVDDIGAVAIIALAYTRDLDLMALAGAAAVVLAMLSMSRMGVRALWPFLTAATLLWLLTLASGIHATIAGVIAALTVPLGRGENHSPLKHLEHAIHPWVMFGIVPLFGFASAGVRLPSNIGELFQPLPLAVMAGLFAGKQLGIFGAIRLAIGWGLAPQPSGASTRHLYGASLLCGIGFTMSLFIGPLAFPDDPMLVDAAKIGTLVGSLLSAFMGYAVLRWAPERPDIDADRADADDIFASDHEEGQR